MQIVNLYAEILANPRNLVAYQDLISHYSNIDQKNEQKALEELVQRKFNANSASSNQEQFQDNQKMP